MRKQAKKITTNRNGAAEAITFYIPTVARTKFRKDIERMVLKGRNGYVTFEDPDTQTKTLCGKPWSISEAPCGDINITSTDRRLTGKNTLVTKQALREWLAKEGK